ncbi:hypothetical protein LOAG_18039 [Loa loa]|uniref:Uncharacterized protein n=1 Tax=Loa loa TaxID=7209 RepID=A0A1S0UGG8_LOALO|nr:hypothetical protein LOAG_18039 [Loa loa]EJD74675.1 hypothetical protein LOAG_18039 [Loa loa]
MHVCAMQDLRLEKKRNKEAEKYWLMFGLERRNEKNVSWKPYLLEYEMKSEYRQKLQCELINATVPPSS